MTLKTPESLASRRPQSSDHQSSSEFPIEGSSASSIEGTSAAAIEGSPSVVFGAEEPEPELALADTLPGGELSTEQNEPVSPILSAVADAKRPRTSGSVKPPAAPRERPPEPDPEKVRLVAEINAVWRRLEDEEDKRQRLGEEVEELHLVLSEEQRARSVAARDKRAAEEKEEEARREVSAVKAEVEALEHRVVELQGELAAQRRQLMAKGAATASGLFGIAFVVGKAIQKSTSRHRGGLFH